MSSSGIAVRTRADRRQSSNSGELEVSSASERLSRLGRRRRQPSGVPESSEPERGVAATAAPASASAPTHSPVGGQPGRQRRRCGRASDERAARPTQSPTQSASRARRSNVGDLGPGVEGDPGVDLVGLRRWSSAGSCDSAVLDVQRPRTPPPARGCRRRRGRRRSRRRRRCSRRCRRRRRRERAAHDARRGRSAGPRPPTPAPASSALQRSAAPVWFPRRGVAYSVGWPPSSPFCRR